MMIVGPNFPLLPDSLIHLNRMVSLASIEMQRKLNHLTILARAILPSADEISTVHERLHKLLGTIDSERGEEEEPLELPPMSLRQIRQAAISIDVHQASWSEDNGIIPHRFSVGDLGYIPESENGGNGWSNFVLIGNVLTEGLVNLEVSSAAEGKQGGWQDRVYRWDTLMPFELPGGVHGCVHGFMKEALTYMSLQLDGSSAAGGGVHHQYRACKRDSPCSRCVGLSPRRRQRDGSETRHTAGRPHPQFVLMLLLPRFLTSLNHAVTVTRAGTGQRFRIRDLRRIQYWPAHSGSVHGFNQPHFGGHSFHHRQGAGFGGHGFGHQPFGGAHGGGDARRLIPGQDLAPKVFYLFTSAEKDHEPYFSLTPMHMPRPQGEKPPELNPSQVRCFASVDM